MSRTLQFRAMQDRRWQLDLVFSAVNKLECMGLTPYNGMVECPPPKGINPFRWKAMILHAYKIIILERGEM